MTWRPVPTAEPPDRAVHPDSSPIRSRIAPVAAAACRAVRYRSPKADRALSAASRSIVNVTPSYATSHNTSGSGGRGTDSERAGDGLGVEQPIDEPDIRGAAPHRPNCGDEPADERARESPGGHLDDEQVPEAGRARRHVSDGTGPVGRQVVEVVLAREPIERVASPTVVDGVACRTAGPALVDAGAVRPRRVQVVSIRPPSRVVGRVEPVADVRGGPDPHRTGETTVERPRGEPLRRFERDGLCDSGDAGVRSPRCRVSRRGRVRRSVAAVENPVFREGPEQGALDGAGVGLPLEAGVLTTVVRDPNARMTVSCPPAFPASGVDSAVTPRRTRARSPVRSRHRATAPRLRRGRPSAR